MTKVSDLNSKKDKSQQEFIEEKDMNIGNKNTSLTIHSRITNNSTEKSPTEKKNKKTCNRQHLMGLIKRLQNKNKALIIIKDMVIKKIRNLIIFILKACREKTRNENISCCDISLGEILIEYAKNLSAFNKTDNLKLEIRKCNHDLKEEIKNNYFVNNQLKQNKNYNNKYKTNETFQNTEIQRERDKSCKENIRQKEINKDEKNIHKIIRVTNEEKKRKSSRKNSQENLEKNSIKKNCLQTESIVKDYKKEKSDEKNNKSIGTSISKKSKVLLKLAKDNSKVENKCIKEKVNVLNCSSIELELKEKIKQISINFKNELETKNDVLERNNLNADNLLKLKLCRKSNEKAVKYEEVMNSINSIKNDDLQINDHSLVLYGKDEPFNTSLMESPKIESQSEGKECCMLKERSTNIILQNSLSDKNFLISQNSSKSNHKEIISEVQLKPREMNENIDLNKNKMKENIENRKTINKKSPSTKSINTNFRYSNSKDVKSTESYFSDQNFEELTESHNNPPTDFFINNHTGMFQDIFKEKIPNNYSE